MCSRSIKLRYVTVLITFSAFHNCLMKKTFLFQTLRSFIKTPNSRFTLGCFKFYQILYAFFIWFCSIYTKLFIPGSVLKTQLLFSIFYSTYFTIPLFPFRIYLLILMDINKQLYHQDGPFNIYKGIMLCTNTSFYFKFQLHKK